MACYTYCFSRDAQLQATVSTSCWHKVFVLYMMRWKSPMASHGRTLAKHCVLETSRISAACTSIKEWLKVSLQLQMKYSIAWMFHNKDCQDTATVTYREAPSPVKYQCVLQLRGTGHDFLLSFSSQISVCAPAQRDRPWFSPVLLQSNISVCSSSEGQAMIFSCLPSLCPYRPPPLNTEYVYTVYLFTQGKGEGGELNPQRGGGRGWRCNSSQSWVENNNMTDCISSLKTR